jgi:magnesium chelatase subunit D
MLQNIEAPDQVFRVSHWLDDHEKTVLKKGSGKRSLMITASNQGRYVRNRISTDGNLNDLALDATLRMAAPFQKERKHDQMALAIEKSDIRVKVREKRTGNTIVFVVDASGSMGANRRMRAVKGAILSLLNDAYQKRDKVGLIAFREQSAEMLLGITRGVDLAQKKLADLPTQGQTPLAAGLDMAYEVIKAAKIKDKDILPVIVLVSDGRATYAKNGVNARDAALASARRIGAENIKTVVVDTEEGFVRLKLAHKLAEAMNADCFELEELRAGSLLAAVTTAL